MPSEEIPLSEHKQMSSSTKTHTNKEAATVNVCALAGGTPLAPNFGKWSLKC